MRTKCGMFNVDGYRLLTVTDISIESDIHDVCSETRIRQTFRNTGKVDVDAIYCFPLYESKVVSRLKITMRNRCLVSVAVENPEDHILGYPRYCGGCIIDSGPDSFGNCDRNATLPEHTFFFRKNIDVMALPVGILAPEETAVAEICFSDILPVEKGMIRYRIPTAMHPHEICAEDFLISGGELNDIEDTEDAEEEDEKKDKDTLTSNRSTMDEYLKDMRFLDHIIQNSERKGVLSFGASRSADRPDSGELSPLSRCSFSLTIGIRNVKPNTILCPAFPVETTIDGDEIRVRYQSTGSVSEKDFILDIGPMRQNEPVCILGRHPNGEKAAMIRFNPAETGQTAPANVVFVIHYSLNRCDTYPDDLIKPLGICLRCLSAGDSFNIVISGPGTPVFSQEPVKYGNNSLRKAEKFVADFFRFHTEIGESFQIPEDGIPGMHFDDSAPDLVLLTASPPGVRKTEEECLRRVFMPARVLVLPVNVVSPISGPRLEPYFTRAEQVLVEFTNFLQPSVENIRIRTEGFVLRDMLPVAPVQLGTDAVFFAVADGIPGPASVLRITGRVCGMEREWVCRPEYIGDCSMIPVLQIAETVRFNGAGTLGTVWCSDALIQAERRGRKRGDALRWAKMRMISKRYNLLTYASRYQAQVHQVDEDGTEFCRDHLIPVLLNTDYQTVKGYNSFYHQEEFNDPSGSMSPCVDHCEKELRFLYSFMQAQNADGSVQMRPFLRKNGYVDKPALVEITRCCRESGEGEQDGPVLLKGLATCLFVIFMERNRGFRKMCPIPLRKTEDWLCSSGISARVRAILIYHAEKILNRKNRDWSSVREGRTNRKIPKYFQLLLS